MERINFSKLRKIQKTLCFLHQVHPKICSKCAHRAVARANQNRLFELGKKGPINESSFLFKLVSVDYHFGQTGCAVSVSAKINYGDASKLSALSQNQANLR